jgi:hypothetical protein
MIKIPQLLNTHRNQPASDTSHKTYYYWTGECVSSNSYSSSSRFLVSVVSKNKLANLSRRQRDLSSSPGMVNNLHFSILSRLVLGPNQPPIQWVPEEISQGVKRPGCEAEHLPPISADVKKTWSIHTLPYTASWRTAWLNTETTLPFYCFLCPYPLREAPWFLFISYRVLC